MKKMLPKTEGETFDERSAGGIVYKTESGKILWLVIKTTGSKKFRAKETCKFPKGHLKKGEFLKQAAIREVEEEGKIKAKVVCKIKSNDYIIWDRLNKKRLVKKVTFFLMKYLEESRLKFYDHEGVTGQEWLSYEEARKNLAYDSEKLLLDKARKRVEDLIK